MKIEVIHFGEDYAVLRVDGAEFEVAKGLGETIVEAQQKVVTHNYYSKQDFPAIGSTFEQEGRTYIVVDNAVLNQSTAELQK